MTRKSNGWVLVEKWATLGGIGRFPARADARNPADRTTADQGDTGHTFAVAGRPERGLCDFSVRDRADMARKSSGRPVLCGVCAVHHFRIVGAAAARSAAGRGA